ncbi:hypothetical protein [Acetanaerobacterium elongatum]|uniref:Uncharacterized protein n=1 Tax=Acetanaerobacterium elongatum TaxID=258515 RepID=A0A1G9XWH8_9FIRM|nr:hypothetical protein [Acetanaerobacterium elongatum]SDN00796.1 hypothetical protein SAMN05192585_10959 [Acetanaerobacterium elongatum]
MSGIKCIAGEQLAYTATTISVALAKVFDLEDINILSSPFCAIGDGLGIIAAQRAACPPDIKTKTNTAASFDKKTDE